MQRQRCHDLGTGPELSAAGTSQGPLINRGYKPGARSIYRVATAYGAMQAS